MIDAFFGAFGNFFATGIGILLLAAITGAIFVLWDWRLALLGTVAVHFGSSSILVLIHGVAGIVAAGQMVAVILSAAMLLLAGFLHPHPLSLRQAGNWMVRLMALIFLVAAWWYLDPGYTLPAFSQPETDLLLWAAICGLALWSFSNSPLLGGAAVLLWSTPMYALAAVLLPGSGLSAIVGITNIIVVLACSYLVLLEPSAAHAPLPGARQPAAHPAAVVPTQSAPARRTRGQTSPAAGGATVAPDPIQEKAVS